MASSPPAGAPRVSPLAAGSPLGAEELPAAAKPAPVPAEAAECGCGGAADGVPLPAAAPVPGAAAKTAAEPAAASALALPARPAPPAPPPARPNWRPPSTRDDAVKGVAQIEPIPFQSGNQAVPLPAWARNAPQVDLIGPGGELKAVARFSWRRARCRFLPVRASVRKAYRTIGLPAAACSLQPDDGSKRVIPSDGG